MFLKPEDAEACATSIDNVVMFGRTLKASIAKDNGKSTDYIKKFVKIINNYLIYVCE